MDYTDTKPQNKSKKILCPDCQRENELPEVLEVRLGDVIECEFCGASLRIIHADDDGKLLVEAIQEEK